MKIQKNAVVELLKKWAEKHSKFKLVYLFGSIAKGSINKFSDVDVAILLDKKFAMPKQYKLKIIDELIELLKTDAVDVVILNYASPSLKYEIIKHGILIVGSEDTRVSFEESAIREYLDTEVLRRFWRNKLIEEVLSYGD